MQLNTMLQKRIFNSAVQFFRTFISLIIGRVERFLDTPNQNKTETAKFRLYSDVRHESDMLKEMRDRIWWRCSDSEFPIGKFSQLPADRQINIAYH